MSDNIRLSTNDGVGDLVRTVDRSGSGPETPVTLIDVGGLASESIIGESGVTMPISGTVAISGTVTVGAHAVTNAGTFAVQVDGAALTALQLLDDAVATTASAIPAKGFAVSGTDGTNARVLKTDASGELQVDVLTLPALPAGDNNIGNVDIVTMPVVDVTGSIIGVTQSGTWNILEVGDAQVQGKAAHDTSVGGAGNPVLVGFEAKDFDGVALPNAVSAEADAVRAAATLSGIQYVMLVNEDGSAVGTVTIQDGGNVITVDGTVAATQSGTWTVQPGNTANTTPWLASIHDGTTKATVRDLAANDALNVAIVDASGNHIVSFGGGTEYTEDAAAAADPVGGALILIRDDALSGQTTADGDNVAARGTDKGEIYVKHVDSIPVTGTFFQATQPVSLASVPSHAVTNAGTFAVQESGAALTALQLIDNASVDHDSAVVAGVRQIGLDARNADPTLVATGDAVRALATLLGKQVVMPYSMPLTSWSYAGVSGGITDTADDNARAAGGSGKYHSIVRVQVVNGHATVSTEVVIKNGAIVVWRGWAQAGGGGVSCVFDPPIRCSENTAVNVANITTGAQTYFNLQGFTASAE